MYMHILAANCPHVHVASYPNRPIPASPATRYQTIYDSFCAALYSAVCLTTQRQPLPTWVLPRIPYYFPYHHLFIYMLYTTNSPFSTNKLYWYYNTFTLGTSYIILYVQGIYPVKGRTTHTCCALFGVHRLSFSRSYLRSFIHHEQLGQAYAATTGMALF